MSYLPKEYVDLSTGSASSARPFADVKRAANQSIATGGTGAALSWDTEITDTDAMWSSGTRITIVTPGNYVLTALATWAANPSNGAIKIYKNGVEVARSQVVLTSADPRSQSVSRSIALTASDYIECFLEQNTGAGVNATGSMQAAWVGGTGAAWGNSAAKAASAGVQTFTTGTETAVEWAAADDFDTDNLHDTVTNNNRITCVVPGTYLVNATVQFGVNATGSRQAYLRKNGTTIFAIDNTPAASVLFSAACNPTGIVQLAVGDYVEVLAQQDSGATRTVGGNSVFSAVRVGYQTNPAIQNTQQARATSSLTISTSSTDVPGATITTPAGSGGTYLVHGVFDFGMDVAGSGVHLGELYVNGVAQTGVATWTGIDVGERASVTQVWLVPIAAGQIAKLRAYRTGGGTSYAYSPHTAITLTRTGA